MNFFTTVQFYNNNIIVIVNGCIIVLWFFFLSDLCTITVHKSPSISIPIKRDVDILVRHKCITIVL